MGKLESGRFPFKALSKALESLYGSNVIEKTSNIKIQAPDVAENGASVPITVSTSIKGIETLSIFIENNPLPLIASYNLRQYAIPNFSVRVKIAKSSPIHVVVKSQGKLLSSSKKIHVSVGGCAEGLGSLWLVESESKQSKKQEQLLSKH